MTVKELIEELKKHKPESTVWFWDDYQHLQVDFVHIPTKTDEDKGYFWYMSEEYRMEKHSGKLEDKVLLV